MTIDNYNWRPITFEGFTFPSTLMAVDVLGAILEYEDEELSSWLWRLPICRGVTKSASADECARCAQKAVDLMLAQRQRVIRGIKKRLVPCGFVANDTYRDWITSLQKIVELSRASTGECSWSAPLDRRDPYQTPADFQTMAENMEKAIERANKKDA